MPIIALIINTFTKIPIKIIFNALHPIYLQIPTGLAIGAILGFLSAYMVIKLRFFKIINTLITDLITKFNLSLFDIILISLLAGVGEEILFRGVLQNLWGIWITSFIFILLHGYFNPKNLNMSVFGIIMFFLSSIIGYTYEIVGMAAAMSLHVAFDFIVLFIFLRKKVDF